MSMGTEIVDSLECFLDDLKSDRPINVTRIQKLSPKPGDIVVLQMPPGITARDIDRVRDAMCRCEFNRDGALLFMLLPDGWSVDVIRGDTSRALKAWQAAWAEQGDAKVHKMVLAASLTEIALKHLEEPCKTT